MHGPKDSCGAGGEDSVRASLTAAHSIDQLYHLAIASQGVAWQLPGGICACVHMSSGSMHDKGRAAGSHRDQQARSALAVEAAGGGVRSVAPDAVHDTSQ